MSDLIFTTGYDDLGQQKIMYKRRGGKFLVQGEGSEMNDKREKRSVSELARLQEKHDNDWLVIRAGSILRDMTEDDFARQPIGEPNVRKKTQDESTPKPRRDGATPMDMNDDAPKSKGKKRKRVTDWVRVANRSEKKRTKKFYGDVGEGSDRTFELRGVHATSRTTRRSARLNKDLLDNQERITPVNASVGSKRKKATRFSR